MRRFYKAFATISLFLFAAVPLATPVSAAIICHGIFQQGKFGPFASIYCMDEEIAKVARSYGEHVTAAEVRNNPMKKVELCMTYGRDNRLKGACGAFSPDNIGIP